MNIIETIRRRVPFALALASALSLGACAEGESEFIEGATQEDLVGDVASGAGGDIEDVGEVQQALAGTKPIHIQKYGPFSSSGTLATGFPTSEWVATVVGVRTFNGDIQENGTGSPFMAYPWQSGGTWRVTFDFRSHIQHEGWEIWVMYVKRELATTANF